jgi:hypothetical protein
VFSPGLCLFESLGVLFVGGFEDSTAEVSFDLLSDVFGVLFDLIEFVAVVLDGHIGVKVSDNVIARFCGRDFTLDDGVVILCLGVHGSLLDSLLQEKN